MEEVTIGKQSLKKPVYRPKKKQKTKDKKKTI